MPSPLPLGAHTFPTVLTLQYVTFCVLHCVCLFKTGFLCSPGCPRTNAVDQAAYLPLSLLELKECTTIAQFVLQGLFQTHCLALASAAS